MMNTLRKTVLTSVGLGAALTLLSAAAWGDAIVTVPEPTGDPSAENQYNVTVVSDALGQPLNPGDTVTLASYTEITSVTEGISSGGVQDASKDTIDTPFRNGQGNWSVDVKLGNAVRALIVTFKSGRKSVVVIATKAKNVSVSKYQVNNDGTVYAVLSYDSVGDGSRQTAKAGAANWTKSTSSSPTPGVKTDAGGQLDKGQGGGGSGGGSGSTTR